MVHSDKSWPMLRDDVILMFLNQKIDVQQVANELHAFLQLFICQ